MDRCSACAEMRSRSVECSSLDVVEVRGDDRVVRTYGVPTPLPVFRINDGDVAAPALTPPVQRPVPGVALLTAPIRILLRTVSGVLRVFRSGWWCRNRGPVMGFVTVVALLVALVGGIWSWAAASRAADEEWRVRTLAQNEAYAWRVEAQARVDWTIAAHRVNPTRVLYPLDVPRCQPWEEVFVVGADENGVTEARCEVMSR